MKGLSSTDDTSFEISNVEPGVEYEIEVVAVSQDDDSNKSEAKSTKVKVPEEEDKEGEDENEDEDEEEQEEEASMSPVSDLTATFKEGEKIIDVVWAYQGPPASFEVDVNNGQQKQMADYNGIEISNATPGQTYTITVTAIGKKGVNEGVRSEGKQTEITIPENEDENENGNNGDGG